VNLEKLWLGCQLPSCCNYRIEPLYVADLKHTLVKRGSIDQNSSFFQRRSNRLFNEHVNPMLEKIDSYLSMIYGGNSKTRRIDPAKELPIICESSGLAQFGGFIRSRIQDVNDADKLHARKFGVQARMVLSDMSNSDDRHLHRFIPSQRS
jgi:hypothetical protein